MLDTVRHFIDDNPARAAVALFAITATFALGGAWLLQLGFGMYPCPLCLEQRRPWYVGGGLALILLALPYLTDKSRAARVQLWALPVLGIALAYGLWRSALHVGVEQGWWTYVCEASGGQISLEDLTGAFTGVACDEIQFEFLGISLAGYNFLLTLIVLIGIAWCAWRALTKPSEALHA